MLTNTLSRTALTVNANTAATAWLNAFLATGQDDGRPALYRTLSVEFYTYGIQLIGCDGTALIRSWIPATDGANLLPEAEEIPERAIVVMDVDEFAITFMRKLMAVTKETALELVIATEAAPESAEGAPLGEVFTSEILTLRAVGQQLQCRLFEGEYPDWRRASYGMDRAELVDGLRIAVRMFAMIGKLKGVHGIECTFSGDERSIGFASQPAAEAQVRGLLMPMRRFKEKPAVSAEAAE